MDFLIRKATQKDVPQILNLIKELADFENEPNAVEITEADLIQDGFKENPAFSCFVAQHSENVVGVALVYKRYSTWKGEILHLEDLIVSQDFRGQGLGTLLLDEVVKYGKKLGVKRISWEVLDWNESAIIFYEKKGANVLRDWHVVQLDEQGIANYLNDL